MRTQGNPRKEEEEGDYIIHMQLDGLASETDCTCQIDVQLNDLARTVVVLYWAGRYASRKRCVRCHTIWYKAPSVDLAPPRHLHSLFTGRRDSQMAWQHSDMISDAAPLLSRRCCYSKVHALSLFMGDDYVPQSAIWSG